MNKYKNFKDDALTADWLRDNGLNHRTFDSAQLNVVRAQKMAHTLLSQHRNLLSTQQLYSLIDFEKSCGDKRKREKITDASCYWVMNTNTSVNRKICMQKRKVKKKKTNPISD
jgi:hypothetical protein